VAVGVITGSGTHALPGFEQDEPLAVETPYGETTVTTGRFGGAGVLHISRHGAGHARMSNVVNHRGNIWALKHLGATAVIGCTACGAVDPELELGSLVIFDDLHFLANRLPDGSLCTFHDVPGDPARGHWILHGGPFSEDIRSALEAAASASGHAFRAGGAYGHVDGPRFNTPSEIAQLAACGVVAVSQTAGPETVLCGELELPFALIGFVTDYANGVAPGEPTAVATLAELMGRSSQVFADVLGAAVQRIDAEAPDAAGTMFRFEAPVAGGADTDPGGGR
jgi:purine nucleoside phosphorylase